MQPFDRSTTYVVIVLAGVLARTDAQTFLQQQFLDALTAYGPGLAVFSPYSYVDIAYDNIPFVGKIPTLGKEGTSSRLGISQFYPPQGNPSRPFPPLYKARPLPMHVPPQTEVVAVPLDEEALHGEPLFPKELVLPSLMESAASPEENAKPEAAAKNPFAEDEETVDFPSTNKEEPTVEFPLDETKARSQERPKLPFLKSRLFYF